MPTTKPGSRLLSEWASSLLLPTNNLPVWLKYLFLLLSRWLARRLPTPPGGWLSNVGVSPWAQQQVCWYSGSQTPSAANKVLSISHPPLLLSTCFLAAIPSSFSLPVASATLLTLTGGLLSSCSSPSPATSEKALSAGVAPSPSSQFPFGGKVDSLDGSAGHTFGQPLSAFPKMRLLPPSPGELTRTYAYEGSEGWFGKHHQQVHTQFYYFLNGKLCRFMALGDPTVLWPEATYLFGPAQAEGKYRLFWEGSRARAAYSEKARGMGMEGQLDVLSKALEAEQAAQAQAKLKAENAQ